MYYKFGVLNVQRCKILKNFLLNFPSKKINKVQYYLANKWSQ